MNLHRITNRSYCQKKFTLPRIDFKYGESQDLEKKEGISPNGFSQRNKKYSKFRQQDRNTGFQKKFKNTQKLEFNYDSKSKLKSGLYSEKNIPITEMQDSNFAYSPDLLEIGDITNFTKIKSNKNINHCTDKNHPLDNFKYKSKRNCETQFFNENFKGTGNEQFEDAYFSNKKPKGRKQFEQAHFSGEKKSSEIIYGIFPVLLALQAKRRSFYKLYLKNDVLNKNEKIQEIYKICQMNNIPTHVVEKGVLRHLTSNDAVHQGICLNASPLPITIEDESQLKPINDSGRRLRLYLNEINDPMNMGAILRTAYLLGVEKVLCSFDNSCPITSVVSKASAGIAEVFPIYTVSREKSYILASKNAGWQILSSSSPSIWNCMNLEDFQPSKNILLIIGNEGRGISKELLELSDFCLSIPPHERCLSDSQTLNASVATSILIYSLMSKLKL